MPCCTKETAEAQIGQGLTENMSDLWFLTCLCTVSLYYIELNSYSPVSFGATGMPRSWLLLYTPLITILPNLYHYMVTSHGSDIISTDPLFFFQIQEASIETHEMTSLRDWNH